MIKKSEPIWQLHLISDATGNLADHMLNSAMSQFGEITLNKHMHVFRNSIEKIDDAMDSVTLSNSIVCHSLASPNLKQRVQTRCDRAGVQCFDLTGELVEFLAGSFNQSPANNLQNIHRIDEQYMSRIDAMEFTMQHDDARRLESAHEADIVIIGLSRVSKSPTSIFLGSLGYKTANVSIDIRLGLPKELDRCEGKIVALTMVPKRLYEIRQRRFCRNGFTQRLASTEQDVGELSYLKLRDVIHEVSQAVAEYKKRGYPVIDVTNMTIEESSAEVIEVLNLNRAMCAQEAI